MFGGVNRGGEKRIVVRGFLVESNMLRFGTKIY